MLELKNGEYVEAQEEIEQHEAVLEPPTDSERITALESAIMELAEVIANG